MAVGVGGADLQITVLTLQIYLPLQGKIVSI